ncbi:MAG TPA: trigger factor, partial [Bacteroidota bacterium]|nr:trigger factor [Bacteroidota bacterium]
MEVSIVDISDVEKEIQIQASANELAPHFEEAYKRYQPKIEIRGFRKGKAPLDLVKKIHGESIEYNSLDTIASDFYRQAVEERNIKPIGEPVIVDLNYKRGENLSVKIKYEIKPAIELKEYKNLPIEKLIHQMTDKEIQDEILRLRKANSTLEEVQTVTDNEHIVTADIQQLDEGGSPLIGKKTGDAKLYLDDETLFPEIKNALHSVGVGAKVRVNIDHTHEDHKHTDHLEISVRKIEKANLPEFNDEFVKKITKEKVGTAVEFEQKLRQDLDHYWNDRTARRLEDAIIREIVQRHPMTVPESLVKGIQDSLIEDLKSRYPNKKLPAEFDEKKFRESNHAYALFQAQWFLIRERIIEAEKIMVEDADLQKQAETDAPNVGIDKERLFKFYQSSAQIKERIVSEKLIEFL